MTIDILSKRKYQYTALTEEKIAKFQELVRKHHGKKISREEAVESGEKLIRLLELVYLPMTEEEYQVLQARRQTIGTFKAELQKV